MQPFSSWYPEKLGFPDGSGGEESAFDAGGSGSIPGLGRSGEGTGYPLQYLAWRNPWTEEPGSLPPTVSQRVRYDSVTNTPRKLIMGR